MAGFEVITYGRFWVIAEVRAGSSDDTDAASLARHEYVDPNYVTAVKSNIEGQLSLAGGRLVAILYATLCNLPQRHRSCGRLGGRARSVHWGWLI